ncbi:MAG: hypothetical protein ACJ8DI_00685 [Ktedonobacteraceae bacterium]
MSLTQVEAGMHRESQSTPVEWQRKHVLLLFAGLATIYIILAVVRTLGHPLDGSQHFIYLADGWLHGHLYLHNIPPDTQDYTLHNGHWYVAFPPLPAVLLLPIVAIFHLSHQAIISLIFSLGIGILNIWLMLGVLKRLARRHLPRLTFAAAAWLTVLFALGTEHLFATMQGNVWYTAHVVATTFLLLYTGETLDKRRPVLAGLYLGLAALSRSTILFTFPFFVLLAIGAFFVNRQGLVVARRPVLWKQLFLFFTVLGTFIAAILLYNQARFGSPLDFGYSTMNVNLFVRGNLHTYGQFNWHFISTNFRYMLLEPPYIVSHASYLTFNPLGTGIFWTTPALLLAFLAFRYRERRWLAASLLTTCLLPMALLLFYFNTGWYQFGYRFVLDFLPFALLLAALGMRAKPGWWEKVLIVLSVAINIWGFVVFTFFHP